MAILNQKKILNVIPGITPQLTVHCSQSDEGSTVEFELYAGSVPFEPDGTASVQGIRKDGTGFGPEAVTLDGSTATVTLSTAMTGVAGPALCEITITETGGSVSTANFALLVEAAAFPNGPLVENSVDVYQQILQYVQSFPASAAADATAKVAAEAALRQAADQALQASIDAEATARAAAVSAEATARAAADTQLQTEISGLQNAVGGPNVAATVAAMADHTKVYVYTGSETGYTAGNWYYWNGSAWVSGGVYNSTAVQTDPTLSVPGMPADAAACGDLKSAITPIAERIDIYNKDTDINFNGAYIGSNGWYVYNDSWAVTKKLPIRSGIDYYYKGLTDVGGDAPVTVYFDVHDRVLGYFKQSTGTNELNIPNGATSIAFSVKTGDISTLEVYGIANESLAETIVRESTNEIVTEKNADDIEYIFTKLPTNPSLQLFNYRNASVINARISSLNAIIEDYRNGYFLIIYPFKVKANTEYRAKIFGTIIMDSLRLASADAVAISSPVIDISSDYDTNTSVLVTTQDADYLLCEANIGSGEIYDVLQGLVIVEAGTYPAEYHQYYANTDDIIDPIAADVSTLKTKTGTTMQYEQIATLDDCAWSWWMYPQAISHHGSKNFAAIGEINSVGLAGIATVNLDSYNELKYQIWQSDIDDHNGMAILELANEFFLVAAAKHGAENKLHLWRTMNRGGFGRMDSEVTIDFGGPVTYCQMFHVTGNKILLFTRVNNKKWYACYSTDAYGQSWETPFEVITADRQYYAMFRPTSDAGWLNVAMYSNPNISEGTDTRIRFAKYNISERKLYDANNNELSSQGSPVNYTDVPIVIDIPDYVSSGTLRNRLLDLAITAPGQYAILYIRFNNSSDGVYHANLNGTDYTLPNGGGCFYEPSCYYPGAIFVPKNTNIVYLGRYTNNRYKLERYELENGSYVYKELIDQSNIDGLYYPVARPVIDVNGEIMFYQKGATLLSSFTRYNYDAKYKELS